MPRIDDAWEMLQIIIGLAVLVITPLFNRWWRMRTGTALLNAVFQGDNDAVKTLLAKRAFVNAKDEYSGRTPLIMATVNGHIEIVKALLGKGADVNVQDIEGWTALMYAREYGHAEILQLLKQAGAEDRGLHTGTGRGPASWKSRI